jgi:hypothetical protein
VAPNPSTSPFPCLVAKKFQIMLHLDKQDAKVVKLGYQEKKYQV